MRHASSSLARRHLVTAIVLVFAFLATGCGSSGNKSASSSGSTNASSGQPTPTSGGKIVYGVESDTPAGFCLPEAQLAISGIQIARSIYDTLTVPNDKGDYVPYLAKSVTPSSDFKEWTIVLRDGIKFHDGTALDATVLKNNLDAYRGKYPNRAPLLFRFVFAPVTDVTVVDPKTVKVTMSAPWPAFPATLYREGRVGIMAQSQLDDRTSCDKNPIGTGPFKITGTISNTQDITLVKNADYWQKDANGVQLPYLDSLEFRAIPDDAARFNALQSKQIDMQHTDSPQFIVQLQPLADSGDISLTISDQQAETAYVMFNSSTEPFNNQAAREAVVYAFNSDQYNQVQNSGLLTAANGPFAPGNEGHLNDTGYKTFDLDKAKAKVAEYKQQTGKDLAFTLSTTNEPVTIQGAQLFQQLMKDAGISVTLNNGDQGQIIGQALGGAFQAVGWRNHPGGDPDGQYIWWRSGSPINFGRINDPDLDKLLDDGRVNSDSAARQKDYEDVNRLFGAKSYNLWQYWVKWAIATQPNVHGIYGPDLPDGGGRPAVGLADGHPTLGLYVTP